MKNLKHFLLSATVVLLTTCAATAQNNIWSQPDNFINFVSGSPSVTPMPASTSYQVCHNTCSDVNGNLLFFIVDGAVYDAQGIFVDQMLMTVNGSSTPANFTGMSEFAIIPVPGSTTRFYIFASDYPRPANLSIGGDPQMYFAVFDIASSLLVDLAGNPQPYVQQISNQFYLGFHSGAYHFAITPKLHCLTEERFLFTANTVEFSRYRITASGIILENTQTLAPTFGNHNGSGKILSEMEIVLLNNGNYKVAFPFIATNSSSATHLLIGNIDPAGLLTTALDYSLPQLNFSINNFARGLEFSPDGNYLYYTHLERPYLNCIDVNTGTDVTAFSTAASPLLNAADFRQSQLEIGSDGNLYAAAANRYARLTNPNTPNAANWNDSYLTNIASTLTYGTTNTNYSNDPARVSYILGDQIDGDVAPANVIPECCNNAASWDESTYNALPTTDTWTNGNNPFGNTSNPVYIKDLLDIPTGANIAINNMEFRFGLNGKVIVHPGATLTLNGTKFTASPTCNTMWQGVEVWGDLSQPNNINAQGKLVMQNFNSVQSCISLAICGIRLWQQQYNGGPVLTGSGGHIFAYNTLFDNNYRSMEFMPNGQPALTPGNESVISNCTFNATNGNMLYPLNTLPVPPVRPYRFITMWGLKNVTFLGTNNFNNADRCIYTEDANYDLSNANFTNCIHGIYSRKIDPAFVSQHKFANNNFKSFFTAMQIDGGMYDQITNNNFNTLFNTGSQSANFEGIRLMSAGGFIITDNRFYSCKAGITVYNSGAMGGSIESNGNGTGNDFSGCWRGIQTFQDNRNLYIRCNRFFNHQALGQYSAAWAIFGSLADQGHNSFSDPYAPVSNQFDKAPLTRVDVYSVANPNGGFNFGYYHYSISSDPLGRPLASTNTVNVLNTSHTRPVDACDGTHLEPTGPYDPQAAIVQIDNEANEAIREMMISRLITWYLDNNQMETAITYLEERGDHAARERLLAIYMDNGSLTEAQALIDEMQGCTDAECLDFIYLNTLLIDWQINNTSPFDMDNQTHDNIQEIAERQNRVSVQAQALLALVYGSEFLPEIIDTAVARMANTNEWVDRDAFIQTLQPNPAKDDLTISFGQAIPMGAELMLTDYTGRLVKQLNIPENSEQATIDVATLSKGIYTVQLMVNKVTHSIKRFSKL
ncbi:MAG: T9SS type A sorting domain-containing protein [Bacteroidia bacterium]